MKSILFHLTEQKRLFHLQTSAMAMNKLPFIFKWKFLKTAFLLIAIRSMHIVLLIESVLISY